MLFHTGSYTQAVEPCQCFQAVLHVFWTYQYHLPVCFCLSKAVPRKCKAALLQSSKRRHRWEEPSPSRKSESIFFLQFRTYFNLEINRIFVYEFCLHLIETMSSIYILKLSLFYIYILYKYIIFMYIIWSYLIFTSSLLLLIWMNVLWKVRNFWRILCFTRIHVGEVLPLIDIFFTFFQIICFY